jgi:glucose/arabinose dehydrogenase
MNLTRPLRRAGWPLLSRWLAVLGLVCLTGCGGGGGGTAAPAPPAPPAPPPAPVPTALVAHAAAAQAGTVNTAVALRPAARVTDAAGRGVAGVVVDFTVVSGGGTVTGANPSTDADGVATVGGWTLGNTVGEQKLSAKAVGLPEATFNAQAAAAPGLGTMTRVANGNDQTATAGAAVAVVPAVRLLNAQGVAQPGVSVSFTVGSGGGTVMNATAVSDAQGWASAGRWTLGPAAGTQTLNASATGYAGTSFSATALLTGAPTLQRTVWLGALQNPWDLAFTPDGAALVSERARGLLVRLADGSTRRLFAPADLVAQDQSGMLGVALDPQFASNRTVFVYMASNLGGAVDNRIVRFTVNADYTAVSNRTDIVTGISYAGGAHSGGRLRFGPDGLLYLTTGDNRTGSVPQNTAVLGGKVLRVTRDGTPAAGNNPPTGANARIYTLGHRNPQGIAFRPAGGRPFLCEHGPGNNDEVTPLTAGGNGGWDPRPRGTPAVCPDGSAGSYCGYNGSRMTDTTAFPAALPPAWTTGNVSQGMSGCGFVSGSSWRDWDGALAVALLSGRRVEVLRLNGDGSSATSTPILNTLNERLRLAHQGPDGALYVLTDGKSGGDEIWRLVPQ